MGDKMKYATIGTSWITQSYIAAAKHTGCWELAAVYSRNDATAKAFADKYKVNKYYTNLSLLANDSDIKAVYIASPNSLHYEQSKLMLLAGKHVICEKPATVTTEEYTELLQIANDRHLIYLEAMMSMHVPALQVLQDNIKSIGKISSARFHFCQLSSKYPALKNGSVPNIFNPDLCTGALMDLGVYNLYLIAVLFGKPLSFFSESHFLNTGADDTTSVILKYKDFLVTSTCSKIGQGYSPSEIVGDEGTIIIESISQLTGIKKVNPKTDKEAILIPSAIDRTEIMSSEAQTFYNLICGNESVVRYNEYHNTAILVRTMCDNIRQNNNFSF